MSRPYEETIQGMPVLRPGPGERHELICTRLHAAVMACLNDASPTKLLERRSPVQLAPDLTICPDLTLVTIATGKPWLLAEIISSEDHRWDTVVKKQMYEELNI